MLRMPTKVTGSCGPGKPLAGTIEPLGRSIERFTITVYPVVRNGPQGLSFLPFRAFWRCYFPAVKRTRHSLWAFAFALLPVFSVAQQVDPDADPVRITGALGGTLSGYQMSGINARQQPLGYSLSGTLNLAIYGWSLPCSVAINKYLPRRHTRKTLAPASMRLS